MNPPFGGLILLIKKPALARPTCRKANEWKAMALSGSKRNRCFGQQRRELRRTAFVKDEQPRIGTYRYSSMVDDAGTDGFTPFGRVRRLRDR
ncbi:hypothetical protein AMJ85_07840 [candidate division BRC1 bacterium SM23_51]|nr:MAG: hypothetical protein AMJ85_07840 [candidate division BRC1 bacterium SM23_51]